jgi:hypothetical protein
MWNSLKWGYSGSRMSSEMPRATKFGIEFQPFPLRPFPTLTTVPAGG